MMIRRTLAKSMYAFESISYNTCTHINETPFLPFPKEKSRSTPARLFQNMTNNISNLRVLKYQTMVIKNASGLSSPTTFGTETINSIVQ